MARLRCMVLPTAGVLLGQTSAGALVGLVSNPSGAAAPNTTVVVTNTQTNVTTRLQTDAAGNCFVPSVLLGVCSLTGEHRGFKKVTVSPVTVSVNQTVRVGLNLPVGDTAESVTVQEYASPVQTGTPTIGQTVNARQTPYPSKPCLMGDFRRCT